MGWGSGVDLFDASVDVAIREVIRAKGHSSEADVQRIVTKMYQVYEGTDWDTESDSCYFFPYLAKTMHDAGQIDDEDYLSYFEEYLSGEGTGEIQEPPFD